MKLTIRAKHLAIVIGTALGCRLCYFYFLRARTFYYFVLDANYYLAQAKSLVTHHHLLSYTEGPLYAIFLAGLSLFPNVGSATAIAQAFLGAASAGLLYGVALRYYRDETVALIAGLLVAVDPFFTYLSAYIFSENLALFLLALFFYFWFEAWESTDRPYSLLAGVSLGLSLLCRGVLGLFMPFLLGVATLLKRGDGFRKAATVILVALLTIAPWEIRLYSVFHRFIFIQVKKGSQLYQSLLPYGTSYEGILRWQSEIARTSDLISKPAASPAEELAVDDDAYARSKLWISNHRDRFIRLGVDKMATFWRPWMNPPHPLPVRVASGLYVSLLYGLALFSLFRFGRDERWFMVTFLLATCAPFVVFFPETRYRLPLHLVLLLLAAGGVRALLGWGVEALR